MIYLDYNATTPLHPTVRDSIITSVNLFGNPSSVHCYGVESKKAIDMARNELASLVKADPDEIVFTSGGTESNNIAIIGFASRFNKGHIISSAIEHPAVLKPLERLSHAGCHITLLPVSGSGAVDPDDVLKAVRPDTILISIMHANNETGVVQPIRDIASIARKNDIAFHTDAAQTVGKMDVDVRDLGIDMLSVAAHKFYGPKGIGALFIRNGITVDPVIYGASQEKGISPGTENIIGITGMGTAAARAHAEIHDRIEHSGALRDLLVSGLSENIKDIHFNGDIAVRLPNTVNVSFRGVLANDIVYDLKDRIAVSSGAACHAGKHEPSHVLSAMGINKQDALSSVRLSVGKFNTEDEIKESIEILSETVQKLRGS